MQTRESSVSCSSEASAISNTKASIDMRVLKSGVLYSFFDELTQKIDLPDFLYYTVILWLILQNIVTVF
jgi:hypothetical protein